MGFHFPDAYQLKALSSKPEYITRAQSRNEALLDRPQIFPRDVADMKGGIAYNGSNRKAMLHRERAARRSKYTIANRQPTVLIISVKRLSSGCQKTQYPRPLVIGNVGIAEGALYLLQYLIGAKSVGDGECDEVLYED